MSIETKDKFLTIRLPESVKKDLDEVAEQQTRTSAAQALHYIKQGLDTDEKNGVIKKP